MADPERFDAVPDPTFQADADPDPKFVKLGREKKCSFKSHFFFSIILHNLSCVIFSGVRGERGEVWEERCGVVRKER